MKLHLAARQPSRRLPLIRSLLSSTVISRFSLRMPESSTLMTSPESVAYTSVFGTQWAFATGSRPPLAVDRIAKCTDELTLLMAILSDGNYLSTLGCASGLAHLYDDFWPPALARPVNHAFLRRSRPRRRAAAVRVAPPFRAPPLQPCPHEQGSRHGDDRQGCALLPIHAGNITAKPASAKCERGGLKTGLRPA